MTLKTGFYRIEVPLKTGLTVEELSTVVISGGYKLTMEMELVINDPVSTQYRIDNLQSIIKRGSLKLPINKIYSLKRKTNNIKDIKAESPPIDNQY